MASLKQIRAGIATVLKAVDTRLTCYPYFGGAIHLPAAVLMPQDADLQITYGLSTVTWPLRLYVVTSATVAEFGQVDLDDYIDVNGSRSIPWALNGEDLDLPGTQVVVDSVTDYGTLEALGMSHISATLNLTVHTPGR